ncbi:MAG TPA: prolyl oligopeptidase family serine peptidase [Mycobacteriales bacterium]|nr:prolyl oligopeptidase family serine peptidase [Mycobacteriales bacterium]
MIVHDVRVTTSTPSAEPHWIRRFRAARVSLPAWARGAPHRCLYQSNASGAYELYAWDRDTGTHRQATARANGTRIGTLSHDGRWIWWFADTDGDEWGVWMREPFDGSAPAEPASPGLGPSYPAGLEVGDRVTAIGRTTGDGSSVHVLFGGSPPETRYASPEEAELGALSTDESVLCLLHSEHGDARHMALRVIDVRDGSTVADLWDGPGRGLSVTGFSPLRDDRRLLVVHERRGRLEPLIWDPVAGTEREIRLDLPGQAEAEWYPDASALLVVHQHAARSELFRYDLDTGETTRLDTPAGVVSQATVRPGGAVEFSWSSAADPPSVRAVGGAEVVTAPGEPAPGSVPVADAWVDGPGGPVHALVSRPPGRTGPCATVFLIHGGPSSADTDAFRPNRAAFVDAGYCVVHVNYRGSTGYGTAWRDALEGRPGLTELEDVAAVCEWAITSGLADPARCVIAGGSWGGYLTLLALGTQPERWAAGLAIVPVADYLAAYEDEMEPLKAFDRSLFGGSPAEVPDLYQRCSPMTYVEDVRAPVIVLAGENDPRCPIRQIDNYLARLAARDTPHEVYRFDAGHGSLVVDEQIRQTGVLLDFCRRHVAP